MQKQFKYMEIKVLKTEADYYEALRSLEIVFDAPADSIDGDKAELLSILIENYENQHYPIEAPNPIEAIKFRMEQLGYNQTDLANVVGLKSRASEILNRKRKLSLEMIRQIHDSLNIPTEVLIQAY